MWVTGGSRCRVNQETPPVRIYIMGNDGITLCREGGVPDCAARLASDQYVGRIVNGPSRHHMTADKP